MSLGRLFVITFVCLLAVSTVVAQKIVYSEPDRDDNRRLNFEIVGKLNGNFLIYKSIRNKAWISVMDNNMKQIAKVEHDYLPDNDKVLNVDFFTYPDFAYMIYQYRKRNIIYCAAAKIDGSGNKVGDLIELDTTQVSSVADNKIYSVVSSEDKSKIMVFKINSKNKKLYMITTMLLDENLSLQKKSRLALEMEDRNDYLSEFQLDNEGDLVFVRFDRVNNENIGKASFVVKYAQADSFAIRDLSNEKFYFDELKIKPDNFNKRYFITSFFYNQRRSNTQGYYFYIWDKQTMAPVVEDTIVFGEELRREARGNATIKTAFNDFFIKNIITRRDGGFIIASESFYTTSSGGGWNRWNYLYGSPYSFRPLDYYYYSPYSYGYGYPYNRWGNYQNQRNNADNIMIMSFDKYGKREWSGIISKEQWEDNSQDLLSYQIMNTGGQVHFLFNNRERAGVQLLNDFTVAPDGQINRSPTLKNLERGYEFMPKYGKQVSARQMIIPCLYKNYICFAKIDYN